MFPFSGCGKRLHCNYLCVSCTLYVTRKKERKQQLARLNVPIPFSCPLKSIFLCFPHFCCFLCQDPFLLPLGSGDPDVGATVGQALCPVCSGQRDRPSLCPRELGRRAIFFFFFFAVLDLSIQASLVVAHRLGCPKAYRT